MVGPCLLDLDRPWTDEKTCQYEPLNRIIEQRLALYTAEYHTCSLERSFLLHHCCVFLILVEEVGGQEAPGRSAADELCPEPTNREKI